MIPVRDHIFPAAHHAPPRQKGRCTFLENDRCPIHSSGFKPKQCRESLGCERKAGPDNYEMGRLWDTAEGRAVVDHWLQDRLAEEGHPTGSIQQNDPPQ